MTSWAGLRRMALLSAFASVLQACGGGGGGASAPAPAPAPSASVSIGGAASGIVGPGLVLQLNGGNDLAVDVSRAFQFDARVVAGTAYQVSIKSNPTGQICSVVANGSGIAAAAVSNVSVECSTPVPPGPDAFRLGGTVSGLTGTGLTLRSGAQDLSVTPSTTQFAFPQSLAAGTPYSVTVATQPASQSCTVESGIGTIGTSDVTNVVVTCVANTPAPSAGLTVDKATLSFVGEEGQLVATQTVAGSISGATGPVFVRIAYTDVGVLFASFASTSATSGQLLVSPRQPINLAPGTYHDTITVEACYDTPCTQPLPGSPRVIDVTYQVRAPAPVATLRLSDRGVALASTPAGSQLSRTLTVRDTSGGSSSWTAESDAPWLAVTASGVSGGQLVLTASPTGLSDGLRMATVMVTSSNASLTPQAIRVGLYLDGATPAAILSDPLHNGIAALAGTTTVADPVRPYVYSAAGASIAVHNMYTGARVATIPVPNASLGGVAASDDGSRLYAQDLASGKIVVVDLDAMAVSHSYGFPQLTMSGDALLASRVAFARVAGQPVLMLTNASRPVDNGAERIAPVFKADSGELLGRLFGVSPSEYLRLAVSRDGTTAYAADGGLSGVLTTTRLELRANSLGNIYGRTVAETTGVNESNLQDIATSPDGSRVYVGYSTDFAVREALWDGHTLSWTAGLAPFTQPSNVLSNGMLLANLETDATGRLFANHYQYDLRIYTAEGLLAQQWLDIADVDLVSGASASMRVSGDGLRLIGNGRLMSIGP